MDVYLIRNLAASILAARTRRETLAGLAQAGDKPFAQLTAGMAYMAVQIASWQTRRSCHHIRLSIAAICSGE